MSHNQEEKHIPKLHRKTIGAYVHACLKQTQSKGIHYKLEQLCNKQIR